MANAKLSVGSISSTSLTVIYTLPSNQAGFLYPLILTNTTSTKIEVDVYTGSELLKTVLIPSGSGKSVRVTEISGGFNASETISLQADSANTFNYRLTGNLN